MSASLLLLVALGLLPIVGLLAFAGCGNMIPIDEGVSQEPPPPPPPVTTPPVTTPPPPPRPAYRQLVQGKTVGLVAYWPLDDPVGATEVADVGPYALEGRVADGTPTLERAKPDGAIGRRDPLDVCTGFPGAPAHVVVEHSELLNPEAGRRFSVEAWVRLIDPAARAGTDELLVCSRLPSASGDNFGWDLFVGYGPDGAPTFTARVFSGRGAAESRAKVLVQSPTSPPGGSWHHVVMAYDGTGEGTVAVHVRLYGEPQVFTGSVTPAPYAPNPSIPLRLGAGLFGLPYGHFHGDLDEVAFYNAPLSETQMGEHHAAAQP